MRTSVMESRTNQRSIDGNHSVADRVLHQFRRSAQSECIKDSRLVSLGSSHGDLQFERDFFGRATLGDELQDFSLPRGETLR